MRLFVAIRVPEELREHCRALQRLFMGIKPVQDFHLTLQFLGDDVPESVVPAIFDNLSKIRFSPLKISLGQARPFGARAALRGVWVACESGGELGALAQRIHAAMRPLGFIPDKPFSPHITLGRYKTPPAKIPPAVDGPAAAFTAREFELVQSHLAPEGPAYKTLRAFSSLPGA